MAWADIADRVLRTAIDTFKTAGTYTRATAPDAPLAISGVFDKPHQQVDPETGALVQSTHPTYGIRLLDLPAAPDSGDTLTIGETTYRVLEAIEDGQGGASLVLHRNG